MEERNIFKKEHKYNRERGQSLVEMAFGLIIIVILFSGLVDLGRVYFVYVAMEDSVGEAALYLSINPQCWDRPAGQERIIPDSNVAQPTTDMTQCNDPNNAAYRARGATSGTLDFSQSEFFVDPPEADQRSTVSSDVNVIMKHRVTLITPIISQIVGDTGLTLTTNAAQPVITEYVP